MPMNNFHVCHLPAGNKKFDRVRPKIQDSGIHLMIGYKGNRSEVISIRYPVSKFSKEEARKRCAKHDGGRFEAAKAKSETRVDPKGIYADYVNHAFPMRGENLIHSHRALHKQWQAEPEKRFGVCERYEERDFIITHTLLVAEIHRRRLEHRYEDDLDHHLPLSLKRGSNGYKGEITSDYIYDTCGEIVATTAEDAKGLIDKIPTAKGVNLKEITDGDDTPFFVVVHAMRVGMSGNRRKYSKEIVEKFRNLHPMPGYESHQHIDRPEYGRHPPMFHQVTAWVGALIIDDELFSKGYVPVDEEKLRRDIRLAHAMSKGMVVSITGKVEQILKKDDDGEFWEVVDIWEGSIDWYQPTATPGIQGAGSVSFKKGKQKSTPDRR